MVYLDHPFYHYSLVFLLYAHQGSYVAPVHLLLPEASEYAICNVKMVLYEGKGVVYLWIWVQKKQLSRSVPHMFEFYLRFDEMILVWMEGPE